MRLTLQRAVVATVASAILAGLVPAGIALDRRLAAAMTERAREDLALAPRALAARNAAGADAMMMHAQELARTPGLGRALGSDDDVAATRLASAAQGSAGAPVLLREDGRAVSGPAAAVALLPAIRRGEMPVAIVGDARALHTVALAPVTDQERRTGAAGYAIALDSGAAGYLAGMTRSTVTFLTPGGQVAATTLDTAAATALARVLDAGGSTPDSVVREADAAGARYLAVAAPLGGGARVIFARPLATELATLPALRRLAMLSAAGALGVALALGALLARWLARPVQQLAGAADRLAAGDFAAPLPTPAVWEVARTTRAFAEMRAALAARLSELRAANTELEDRAARLTSLQAELIQRDRLAASGRLVAQLAHEIRNPVANLRNCLELLHRRLADDPEGREFADLAIDELLRMHELAEQMLDLNRPRESGARVCDVAAVAREVAALATAGAQAGEFRITVTGLPAAAAAIAPDACKQILINLVQNAREAMTRSSVAGGGATNATNAMNATTTSARAGGHAEIAVGRENGIVTLLVRDDGPGFAPDVLPRVFDPFFTTKAAVRGVGLGLFVAEGLVRTAGGRIAASNAPGGGAEIRVELPAAADTGATE